MALLKCPKTERDVRIRAENHARLEPCIRKTAIRISSTPDNKTNPLEALINPMGKKFSISFTREGIAGVMAEITLTMPSKNMNIAGKIRRIILSLFEKKLTIPENKGSQNSNSLNSKVTDAAWLKVNPY